MKAIVVRPGPHFSVADVSRGWVKGLQANGVDVVDFNFDERLNFYCAHPWVKKQDNPGQHAARLAASGLEAACYSVQPDLVVIVSGFYIPPSTYQLLRARGVKVVLVHTESPYEDDRQIARAAHADVNVVNDPTNLDRFQQVGQAMYLPHAYDPDIHHPQAPVPGYGSEFCFVGTGYQSRIDFFEAVNWDGVDAAFAGNWQATTVDSPLRAFLTHDVKECCPNEEAVKLYASTKASVNVYRKEATAGDADGWAMGPREVELAACGTFFLRESRPETDQVLPMLPTFAGPGDFEEKLRWWLDHDAERADVALKAREAVADRTFPRNAAAALTAAGF